MSGDNFYLQFAIPPPIYHSVWQMALASEIGGEFAVLIEWRLGREGAGGDCVKLVRL